jgi:hypothetical protein
MEMCKPFVEFFSYFSLSAKQAWISTNFNTNRDLPKKPHSHHHNIWIPSLVHQKIIETDDDEALREDIDTPDVNIRTFDRRLTGGVDPRKKQCLSSKFDRHFFEHQGSPTSICILCSSCEALRIYYLVAFEDVVPNDPSRDPIRIPVIPLHKQDPSRSSTQTNTISLCASYKHDASTFPS